MFERFGEMSSCREINELAENLLNEGDIQSLKVMAQENGIPEDYYKTFSSKAIRSYASKRATIHKYLGFFTPLGKNFFEVCVK